MRHAPVGAGAGAGADACARGLQAQAQAQAQAQVLMVCKAIVGMRMAPRALTCCHHLARHT